MGSNQDDSKTEEKVLSSKLSDSLDPSEGAVDTKSDQKQSKGTHHEMPPFKKPVSKENSQISTQNRSPRVQEKAMNSTDRSLA